MALHRHLHQPDSLLSFGLGLSLTAVGLALISQHVFGMEPCPWCVLQRLVFVAIALVCGLGLLWTTSLGHRVAACLVGALSASGMAAALWQHFVAAASNTCNLTLADKIVGILQLDRLLPEVFAARASCADAAVNLLGLPYEYWSLAVFVLLAAIAIRLFRKCALVKTQPGYSHRHLQKDTPR
jgi:protein dithiol:quinone oxidoreductase